MENSYLPFSSKILEIIKHNKVEYTFRMEFSGKVLPGQFFEVSIPKFGEAPISVSGIGENYVDLTIRKVGKVTNEIFENGVGQNLWLRGPYGNGFNLEDYVNKELIIMAGGTGVSPVKGVIDYFSKNRDKVKDLSVVVGYRSLDNILFHEEMKDWEKNSNFTLTLDNASDRYDGNVGYVVEYVNKLQINNLDDVAVIVVGPPVMMSCTTDALIKFGIGEDKIWVSQERKMCCGIGKCGHCKVNDKYICLDGPVFTYLENKELID